MRVWLEFGQTHHTYLMKSCCWWYYLVWSCIWHSLYLFNIFSAYACMSGQNPVHILDEVLLLVILPGLITCLTFNFQYIFSICLYVWTEHSTHSWRSPIVGNTTWCDHLSVIDVTYLHTFEYYLQVMHYKVSLTLRSCVFTYYLLKSKNYE